MHVCGVGTSMTIKKDVVVVWSTFLPLREMYQFAVVFPAPVKVGKAVEFFKRLHEL